MAKSDDLISAMELRDNFGIDIMSAPQMMQVASAAQFAQQQNEFEQAVRQARARVDRNDAAIQRTAQESIEHTRLLEKQLQEVQAQNELLKAEAAANQAEIEANKKAAKKARRLNIAAFVLSIVLPIISIGASVLIAIFL